MGNQPNRDLLNADELLRNDPTPTKWTKRLANVLIDLIVFYALLLIVGVVLAIAIPSVVDTLEDTNTFVDRLVSSLLFSLYCFGCEVLFGGKTLGKLITKTHVVDDDGNKPTTGALLKRSLCRMIPFDAFSFFSENPVGWHDRYANTMVVDDTPVSLDRTLAVPETEE